MSLKLHNGPGRGSLQKAFVCEEVKLNDSSLSSFDFRIPAGKFLGLI
jgi:hypothetical protein